MGKMIKDRFHISRDELESRMEKQKLLHDDPIKKAVEILQFALDKVMKKLGVDVDQEPEVIHAQQEQLGIIVTEETREDMAGLNGFFVSLVRKGDIIPYAWIGSAQLNSMGECSCEVHWFQDNRLDEVGGIKLIK